MSPCSLALVFLFLSLVLKVLKEKDKKNYFSADENTQNNYNN